MSRKHQSERRANMALIHERALLMAELHEVHDALKQSKLRALQREIEADWYCREF